MAYWFLDLLTSEFNLLGIKSSIHQNVYFFEYNFQNNYCPKALLFEICTVENRFSDLLKRLLGHLVPRYLNNRDYKQ
jgi:hypothetical protein